MGQFIFRMPENTPDLDFTSLEAYIRAAYDGEGPRHGDHAEIGTTVQVVWHGSRRPGLELPPAVDFQLYGLHIARIFPDRVNFAKHDDPHMATGEWVAKIIRDNAIGTSAGRIRRRKADGEGPWMSRGRAGLLVIDGDRDKPVTGRTYPVGDIEGMHRRNAESEAAWAAERERWVPYYERSNVVWEASRLHRALAGDEQAARDLDDLGIRLDTGQAETQLAALTAQLAGLDAQLAERGLPAGDEPGLLAELRNASELTARNSRKQETRS